MSHSPGFLFATCQIGAEPALKDELARVWPSFRFAYSRPGFLTFKLPPGPAPTDNFDLQSIFARSYGFSLGKADGATIDERAKQVKELVAALPINRVHVWPRDTSQPGAKDDEPEATSKSPEIAEALFALRRAGLSTSPSAATPDKSDSTKPAFRFPLSALPRTPPTAVNSDLAVLLKKQGTDVPRSPAATADKSDTAAPLLATGAAEIGQLVADVVLINESLWWVGFHRAHSTASAWPGGLFVEPLPADAVSRVYLKMLEAIRWAGFRIGRGQRVVEIGCAPGGASQAMLDLGAKVVGIDPAQMHPLVMGHPRFRHIRRRSKEVRRSDFIGVDWLACDINLPPNYTLDTVEAAVAYPGVKLQGLLLTLKLIDWSMAAKIPEYLDRIRSWGFRDVAARQLHHNRREICVAASNFF
ncbi:MAG: hypothetical protein EXS05_15340 [Planctomycetaceae bacterium]|nr:hypothetical protein [Planctomycetaceae bacterium]